MDVQKSNNRPDFLVIGGMKCASTTMHADLSLHPSIECGKKELNALLKPDLEEIATIYGENYHGVGPEKLLGDVSADYSTLPTNSGVAQRAFEIAPDLKIVYIVRNPVRRALSHHQHMMNWSGEGQMVQDVNLAIGNHPELISYSCYAMQLQPWIEAFGLENILVVKFEDYVDNRMIVANQVCRFLGLPEADLELNESGSNRGESRRYAGKMIYHLYRTNLFKKVLQPATPNFLKQALRRLLLRKNKLAKIPPTRATLEQIALGVRADISRFETLLGYKEPLWDIEHSIEQILLKQKGN